MLARLKQKASEVARKMNDANEFYQQTQPLGQGRPCKCSSAPQGGNSVPDVCGDGKLVDQPRFLTPLTQSSNHRKAAGNEVHGVTGAASPDEST